MSIEKLVEQDFQALETSFSQEKPLSEVALARCLEQIQLIGDADRIAHWHDELRRIGGLPPEQVARGDAPPTDPTLSEAVVATTEPVPSPPDEQVIDEAEVGSLNDLLETGGDGSLLK